MKKTLYEILLELMYVECVKCPQFNPRVKEEKISNAIREIQNSLIRDVLPNIMNHKFDKDEQSEIIAHVGGFNNCRAISIRSIRRFCLVREDKPSKSDDVVLID